MTAVGSTARDALSAVIRSRAAPLLPDEAAIGTLLAACRIRRPAKGEGILRPGEVAGEVLFVHAGLLRMVSIDPESGAERTEQFFDDGMVFTEPVSFLARAPAAIGIDAIEASEVIGIPYAALLAAYDADHAIERFGRLMVEEALMGTHRRATRLLNLDVQARYETFLRTRPEVARRVPQYLIASYLGVTPEALSRVRRRIAKGGR